MTLNLWKSLRFVSAVLIWLNGVKDSLAGCGSFRYQLLDKDDRSLSEVESSAGSQEI